MSFYIDPWLYNCAANRRRRRTTAPSTTRAWICPPRARASSASRPSAPAAARRTTRATGTEQADVAAPGGDFRDFPHTDKYKTPGNLILAPYPEAVGRTADPATIDANGNPTTPFVVKDTKNGPTAYYQWILGTSMAAPHAVGVAALIVSQYGRRERSQGGLTPAPDRVQQLLEKSATDTPCPTPRLYEYDSPDLGPEFNAYCEGGPKRNGFFGDGVVDALAAIHARG
jgi:subtilisin family serine protease